MPITNATGTTAVTFIPSIIFRFGIPHSIITGNGSNFLSHEFQDFCEKMGIHLNYATVAHPQTNGQVEKVNGLLTVGIKKRLMTPLHRAAGAWVKELPSVLLSLRTTPNGHTKFTPFFMVYGAEAVLPSDVRFNAPRVTAYSGPEVNMPMEDALDAVDEARDVALTQAAVYQQSLCNYFNRQLRSRSFVEGDLVLRLKEKGHHKLQSPWEGTYVVTKVIPGGAYYIKDMKSGVTYSKPWNAAQLRRFYA
ncbi:uncharacterized protein K02A2.6-like [Brachypodium distachyon]|uniref:uncharacterized protein K02A2.6-like n=1 Tax=Brachypodium distachyon TaxID=15368 RepID=UPI00052FEE9F|nr:uncharacterized protein K02A2.6-like [Brachypodium distachyon]|eukprot:XP_010239156.1 uncharacterized protein K02A2.6-like [Brachypodium distachyon]